MIKEECGIFGIYSKNNKENSEPVYDVYNALLTLQHRGQVSAGIAVSKDGEVTDYCAGGLVSEVFPKSRLEDLASIKSPDMILGHVNNNTNFDGVHSQPLAMRYLKGSLTIASNGSLVNSYELKELLEKDGAIFQTDMDAEIIAYLIATKRIESSSVEEAIKKIMPLLQGSFSFVVMTPHKMIGVRDPLGMRPLSIGKVGDSYMISSESSTFDIIGGEFIRDVKPGEIFSIRPDNTESLVAMKSDKTAFCAFEYIYFSGQDSVLNGLSVHKFRYTAGQKLYEQSPIDADIVFGVPDSGIDAALGFSSVSGIPFELGFIKNKYIGRTLQDDELLLTQKAVKIKLCILKSVFKDKRVVLVDDSIVKGVTIKQLVELIKKAGAKEIHVRITSPPFKFPCYYGTDLGDPANFLYSKIGGDIKTVAKNIGADSVEYLSIETLKSISEKASVNICSACFDGNYPTKLPFKTEPDKYSVKLS
ncbi:MAG: amidophosphoribosyltransferase [Clostridia bacterium]|nr:amidophosphoribosyltransferase [Clostridia bacterium]